MVKIEVVSLKNKEKIKISKITRIVASECGINPLIYVCKKIAKQKKINLEWFLFKTPRSRDICVAKVLINYLSKKEKNEK